MHKKFLIQAAACNLALLMRSLYGAGKPRAAHESVIELFSAFLALLKAFDELWSAPSPNLGGRGRLLCRSKYVNPILSGPRKTAV